jgi:hypothetical protein
VALAIDIIIFLFLGLLGLESVRRLLHRFAPAIKPIYLDLIYLLILLAGAYLFFPKAVTERELREELKTARVEIERQRAPRSLSSTERVIITEAIRSYAGHEIKVAGIGNPESELYANEFATLLETSKWKVEKIHGALLGPPQYGIFLVTSEKPDQAVQALISAMKKAGIKFKPQTDQRLTPDEAILRVGDKDPTENLSKPSP